jgi:DNA-binding Lrp family transcriptional regulator
VDPVDFAVYRYLSPGGEARFWAGRRVIDPTIPAREIADHVGVSENAVRSRLKGLASQGFLRGSAVTPNPSLFGASVHVIEIPVPTPVAAEQLIRDLELIEGVVFARDTLGEGDRSVRVHFVSDRESTLPRQLALLRRLAPSEGSLSPTEYLIPPCAEELSTLDWKLLDVRMRQPDAEIGEIARAAHVSAKTTARRLHRLVGSRAFWWTHGADSEEFPLALVRVFVTDPAQREPIARSVQQHAPAWMPVAFDGLGLDPTAAGTVVAGLVPADAPTALERQVGEYAKLPGVVRVVRTFPLGSRTYPAWFADRVADHVPARATAAKR